MLFNSLSFLIFFPVVTTLYFLLPHRFRWLLLLVASCIFYMAFVPAYILFLFAIILIDYAAGIAMEKTASDRRRRLYLVASLVGNIGLLAIFKYYNFAASNLNALGTWLDWNYSLPLLGILLPIGLSFHTFQAMSYTIEVYRRRHPAERHLGIYALYVLFYPQLVAGPIERPQNLIHQFREVHSFDYGRVAGGLKLMWWGMFKKVVIADRAALFVDAVYNQPEAWWGSGPSLVIATVLFAIQIFCDFSGYTDIARGAAAVMGIRLMENFKRPYLARTVADFWRRWHISLSTWFRDYVYIPLGGNRVSLPRQCFNIAVVFVVSGLWHGANWTFIIWGALHALYMVSAMLTAKWREQLRRWVGAARLPRLWGWWQMAATFMLVCLAWVFFRAGSVQEAWGIISHFGAGWGELWPQLRAGNAIYIRHTLFLNQSAIGVAVLISAVALLKAVHWHEEWRGALSDRFAALPRAVRWGVYSVALWSLIFLGEFGAKQFIYFTF